MSYRRTGLLLAALLALAGCSSDPEPASSPSTVETSPAAPDSEVTPERQGYLDAMAEIDPGFAGDPEAVVGRTRAVCEDLSAIEREQVVDLIPSRFGSLITTASQDLGERVMTLVESTKVCDTFS
jgi:hypothetical protein